MKFQRTTMNPQCWFEKKCCYRLDHTYMYDSVNRYYMILHVLVTWLVVLSFASIIYVQSNTHIQYMTLIHKQG